MNSWQTTAAALCVLTGTVFDAQHHPMSAAKVFLRAVDQEEGATVETDASGRYRFAVPHGKYTIRVDSDVVTIRLDADKTVDVTVQPPFFDEPKYTAAGVTDYTYRGGHGSDTVLHSVETLVTETGTLTGSGDQDEETVFQQGTSLLNHKTVREAVEVFQKGVRRFPGSVRMALGLASAYYAMSSYDEAARWFYKATDISPKDEKPYLFLGEVKARQITGAQGYKERMARFVQLQPGRALAHYYYGTTLGDDQARGEFEKALVLDPNLAAAHVKLGIIAGRKGERAEAIRLYRKAIGIDPNLSEARYRLSEAYRLTGEKTKAEEERIILQRLSK